MDYKTKSISRKTLRELAVVFRRLFHCKKKYCFDVIGAFERISVKFPMITTTVVEDHEIEGNIPGRCIPDYNGRYLIEIKNSVYEGALKNVGGYRAHILHEMCHAFLCLLGFTPILECSFKNNDLKPYESMEWQAKALCGEIMMPYEETKNLTVDQIMKKCKVSKDSAILRFFDYDIRKMKIN